MNKLTKLRAFLITVIAAVICLSVIVVFGQQDTTPIPTAAQQWEFQLAQHELDLAQSRLLTVVYKIRSEVGAPEAKYDARVVNRNLVFTLKPTPEKP